MLIIYFSSSLYNNLYVCSQFDVKHFFLNKKNKKFLFDFQGKIEQNFERKMT